VLDLQEVPDSVCATVTAVNFLQLFTCNKLSYHSESALVTVPRGNLKSAKKWRLIELAVLESLHMMIHGCLTTRLE
jgi:hypothetical protein